MGRATEAKARARALARCLRKGSLNSDRRLCARQCLAGDVQVWFHPKQIGMMTIIIAAVITIYRTFIPCQASFVSSHFRNEERIIIIPTLQMRQLRLTKIPCKRHTAAGI